MLSLDGLSTFDCLRSGAVVIAFSALLIGERVTKKSLWLRGQSILNLVVGLMLLACPDSVFGHAITGKFDSVSRLFARALAINHFIFESLVWGYSTDKKEIFSSLIITRVLRSILSLVLMGVAQSQNNASFKPTFVSFFMLIIAMQLVGDLCQLLTTAEFSVARSSKVGDVLSKCFLFTIILSSSLLFMYILFPGDIHSLVAFKGYKPNYYNTFLAQLTGGTTFVNILYIALGLRFVNDGNRGAMVKTGFLVLVLSVLNGIVSQYLVGFNNQFFVDNVNKVNMLYILLHSGNTFVAMYYGKAKSA